MAVVLLNLKFDPIIKNVATHCINDTVHCTVFQFANFKALGALDVLGRTE